MTPCETFQGEKTTALLMYKTTNIRNYDRQQPATTTELQNSDLT